MSKLMLCDIRNQLNLYRQKIRADSNDPTAILEANFSFPIKLLRERGLHQNNNVSCNLEIISGIKCYIIRENNVSRKRKMIYFHGGAYMYGGIDEYYHICAMLSEKCNCEIIFVEYSLAPQSTFPMPIMQGIEVYKRFIEQGCSKIFLCGDSAGATIEVAMIFKMMEQKLPCPDAFVSICISGDEERKSYSWIKNKDSDFVLGLFSDKLRNDKGKTSVYLCGHAPSDYMVSPINGNFRKFPPCLLQVSDNECLRDDTLEIYLKMTRESVDATLEVYEDVPHVWHLYAPLLDSANRAINNIGKYILRR